MGGVSFFAVVARVPHALHYPILWVYLSVHVAILAAAILRGWPFDVRFAILATGLLTVNMLVAATVGIVPNWAVQIMILVATGSLFYGPRCGWWLGAAIIVSYAAIAWGWVSGHLPVYVTRQEGASILNLESPQVWIRILVIAAALLSIVLVSMSYVLGDLNEALRDAKRSLGQLAVEQEHRARAEEARLTAERSAREAQKFDALGRLASGVAHDFNNALCVMKCWSSVLIETSSDPEVREAMHEIKRSTENAEQLTQHLLAFSRSDSGRREVADLGEVVRQECRTLSRLLPKSIVVEPTVDGIVHVPLGKGQLQEILLNLAINARDAMPGGGRLTIQAGRSDLDVATKTLRAGRYASLVVSDTGAGMDEAVMSRIFEPFFTTKPHGKGTGLGLAMVFGLVSGAGGSIAVASRPGEGSTFTILLPEASGAEAGVEQRAESIVVPMRCRVLVVDAKQEIGALVERILTRDGFPTVWVRDGRTALEAIAAADSRFGLVIIQGALPEVSTLEVIRAAEQASGSCRFVVISAPVMDPAITAGVSLGRLHLLMKPFEADRLRAVVSAALTADPSGRAARESAG